MTVKESLKEVLDKHYKWSKSIKGGECAELRGAKLSNLNIPCTYLACAGLKGTDFENSYLDYSDLACTNLSEANLGYTDLTDAYLVNVKLYYTVTNGMKGYTVYSIQMPLKNNNVKVSYWKDLDLWEVAGFQGIKEDLLICLKKMYMAGKINKDYMQAIEIIESISK